MFLLRPNGREVMEGGLSQSRAAPTGACIGLRLSHTPCAGRLRGLRLTSLMGDMGAASSNVARPYGRLRGLRLTTLVE